MSERYGVGLLGTADAYGGISENGEEFLFISYDGKRLAGYH